MHITQMCIRDSIRTVDPHEMRGKPFFHFLEAGKRYYRLVLSFHKDTHILTHPLNIADILHIDANPVSYTHLDVYKRQPVPRYPY